MDIWSPVVGSFQPAHKAPISPGAILSGYICWRCHTSGPGSVPGTISYVTSQAGKSCPISRKWFAHRILYHLYLPPGSTQLLSECRHCVPGSVHGQHSIAAQIILLRQAQQIKGPATSSAGGGIESADTVTSPPICFNLFIKVTLGLNGKISSPHLLFLLSLILQLSK